MSAWTWTFVKAKSIPKNIIDKICNETIKNVSNTWYYKESKKDFQKTLKKWINVHNDDYDYLIKNCGLSPDELTNESLKKKLIDNIKAKDDYINDLNLVKEGKFTLDKILRKYKIWKLGGCGEPFCYYINNTVWVHMNSEIFRLREYSNMNVSNGLKTIDDLIEYLSNSSRQSNLIWWENGNLKEGLFPEFEKRLREYYGQFGDGNFSVHFG